MPTLEPLLRGANAAVSAAVSAAVLVGIDTTAIAGLVGGALALLLPQILGRVLTHGDRAREDTQRREDAADAATQRLHADQTAALERCEEKRGAVERREEDLRERWWAARDRCRCGAFAPDGEGPVDLRRPDRMTPGEQAQAYLDREREKRERRT